MKGLVSLDRVWTRNLTITSALLYQLSYPTVCVASYIYVASYIHLSCLLFFCVRVSPRDTQNINNHSHKAWFVLLRMLSFILDMFFVNNLWGKLFLLIDWLIMFGRRLKNLLLTSGSVAERSKVSNSGSNGCEFEPRARTSVLRWPLNANFHRLSRSHCYFVSHQSG